jgi:hypothetical protein
MGRSVWAFIIVLVNQFVNWYESRMMSWIILLVRYFQWRIQDFMLGRGGGGRDLIVRAAHALMKMGERSEFFSLGGRGHAPPGKFSQKGSGTWAI